MIPIDPANAAFGLALELVNHTSRDIFLTGKAGTGKTTFLRYIRENCPKKMAIVAPTGVAAINAGGVTIHSFFQLPLSPFIPESRGFDQNDSITNKHSLIGRLRLNSERRKILQELELLVIDEISMVRCDVLDAVDTVLRHVRHQQGRRFGGVQVLLIGDMYQLAPVVRDQEWNFLSQYYDSPYFFDSRVIHEQFPVYIEFTKIYRQTDSHFINLLHQVRNNELTDEGLELLQSRYRTEDDPEGYVILTTHNEKARQINTNELRKLEMPVYEFAAETEGDFSETAYPADLTLQLKVGAQVMFLRNDTEKARRYFNGKIGVVKELEEDRIVVECPGDVDLIDVKQEEWENIRYSLNAATRQLEEEVIGSFKQYPLRLAWAITIHKSQGLTFDKAIIDAGEAFTPGQVYVALSRCTSLEGMILHSKIRSQSLFVDPRIVAFSKKASSPEDVKEFLDEARKDYHEKMLSDLFDCRNVLAEMKRLREYVLRHNSSFSAGSLAWTEGVVDLLDSLQSTSHKFHIHLAKLFAQPAGPEENSALADRVVAGARYFLGSIEKIIEQLLLSPVETDSRQHAKEVNDTVKDVFIQLSFKKFQLAVLSEAVDLDSMQKRKNGFIAPPFSINAYSGSKENKKPSAHPVLYQKLKKRRDDICNRTNMPIYMVLGSRGLDEMVTYLPQTLEELEQISGFGKAKIEKFGQQFIDIICEYSREKGLSSRVSEIVPKKIRKDPGRKGKDTKAESFKLFMDGKSIEEIARDRNLTVGTIEGHLAHHILTGVLHIDKVISQTKRDLIAAAMVDTDENTSIGPLKNKLGDEVSYADIRFVQAWMEHQKPKSVIDLSTHVNH